MFELILYIISFFVIVFNWYVSIQVLKVPYYQKTQKIGLILLIWLIPIIGAIIVINFVPTSQRKSGITHSRETRGQANDLGGFDGAGSSGGGE